MTGNDVFTSFWTIFSARHGKKGILRDLWNDSLCETRKMGFLRDSRASSQHNQKSEWTVDVNECRPCASIRIFNLDEWRKGFFTNSWVGNNRTRKLAKWIDYFFGREIHCQRFTLTLRDSQNGPFARFLERIPLLWHERSHHYAFDKLY